MLGVAVQNVSEKHLGEKKYLMSVAELGVSIASFTVRWSRKFCTFSKSSSIFFGTTKFMFVLPGIIDSISS